MENVFTRRRPYNNKVVVYQINHMLQPKKWFSFTSWSRITKYISFVTGFFQTKRRKLWRSIWIYSARRKDETENKKQAVFLYNYVFIPKQYRTIPKNCFLLVSRIVRVMCLESLQSTSWLALARPAVVSSSLVVRKYLVNEACTVVITVLSRGTLRKRLESDGSLPLSVVELIWQSG